MKLSKKLVSSYSLHELFSFISSEKRKLNLIKYNSILLKKLDLSVLDYKKMFFFRKLKNYDFVYFKHYYQKIKEYEIIENEEELNDILLYCLSKNKNFNLKLSDEQFQLIITNSYFKENLSIFLENNEINSYLIEKSIKNIYKLSLIEFIDIKFLQFLNNTLIFKNLTKLDISIPNLNNLIDLKIICPNIDELNLNILENTLKYNINEINYLFPNIQVLNLYIESNFNILELIAIIINSNIKTLKISIDDDINIDFKIESQLILESVEKLEINLQNISNVFLFNFLDKIQFPNLKKYILNFTIDDNIQINTLQFKEYDYNIINNFILDVLRNKQEFCFKIFFSLPNQLKLIEYLELNINIFSFIYKKKNNEKYLFKFNLFNEAVNYYKKLDLLIDEIEILKYKNIDIKGINICNLYLNINQNFNEFFEKLSSIYYENEQNNHLMENFFSQIQNTNNLKYINLNLNNDFYDNNNLLINHKIIELIQNSKNLKSLILRLNTNNFEKNVCLIFQSIQNLKKLKVLNIIQNDEYPKCDFCLEKILDQYPLLKKRRYCFDEFKIDNEGFMMERKKKNNFINYDIKCIYNIDMESLDKKIRLFNTELKGNSVLYLNHEKINDNRYRFRNIGKYILKIKFLENISNIREIFSYCSSLTSLNLSNFNFNNVKDMNHMFCDCYSLKYINLSNINTINVENMSRMFYECSSLTSLNLSNFNTNNVQDMSYMFYYCSSLTYLNISNFNTINVKDMSYMFCGCSSLTSLNLSNFKTNNVENLNFMFYDCTSLTSLNLSNFNTNNVQLMSYIFSICSSLTSLDLSNFNTDNIWNINNMFFYCSSLIDLDLSNFNTNNIDNMSYMFSECSALASLNISNFNTMNVDNMSNMFSYCSSLISLNLSNFNTINVKDMSYMFSFCSSLTSLNLSNFNTNNVENMNYMFCNCSSLTSLNLSNFNTNNVINMSKMFYHCSSLPSLNLSNFNTDNVNDMSFMFYGCSSLSSLNISNFNIKNVQDTRGIFYNLNDSCEISSTDILLKEIYENSNNKKIEKKNN